MKTAAVVTAVVVALIPTATASTPKPDPKPRYCGKGARVTTHRVAAFTNAYFDGKTYWRVYRISKREGTKGDYRYVKTIRVACGGIV
jgi:hypothetical protein